MRHRIKAGKVGSFTPEKQKVEIEQLENKEVAEDVEEIFEEDSEFSNDDEALAAMEFYDSPDAVVVCYSWYHVPAGRTQTTFTSATWIVLLLWTLCVQTCRRHHQTVAVLMVIGHRHRLMVCGLTGRHRPTGKVVLPTSRTICVALILHQKMTWRTMV